jgi:hypothetical protein
LKSERSGDRRSEDHLDFVIWNLESLSLSLQNSKTVIMPILRTIKSDYEFYHHQELDILIALDAENGKAVSTYWKTNKGKQKGNLPNLKVTGYKLVPDEEFQSLKIDFSKSFQFEAKHLLQAKLQ